jgi:TfoX/Sxy family transcriptional regulator of competence genes
VAPAIDPSLILDQLSPIGKVSSRPLFGGPGLSWRDGIFAPSWMEGKLHLKVDDPLKPDSVDRDMPPFRPNERQTLRTYHDDPPDVLDDSEALLSWAGGAIQAGLESRGP